MESVQEIFQAAGVPIQWDTQLVQFKEIDPRTNSFITRENLDAVLVSARSATLSGQHYARAGVLDSFPRRG